jgi:hypothetical protein
MPDHKCGPECIHHGKSIQRVLESNKEVVMGEAGWIANAIFDSHPPYLYTTGLYIRYMHPDLVIFGLPSVNEPNTQKNAAYCTMYELIEERIKKGEDLKGGEELVDVLRSGYNMMVFEVEKGKHDDYFAMGENLNQMLTGERYAPMFMLVWQDAGHKYPWEEGYAHPKCRQPEIYKR